MFRRQTLFVIGAGSSAEVEFPVGKELARIIGRKMDIRFERAISPVGTGDFELFDHIRHAFRDEADDFQKAAWRIRDGIGFAQSIDDFLDQHRTDGDLNLYGKAAIVRAILEAERASKLYFNIHDTTTTFDLAASWFVKFMYMLARGVPKENVREIFDPVSFIIFNYDRCVEHFLRNALQRLYNISDIDACDIVGDLHILHPYGVVGSLKEVPFGATRVNYVSLAAGIKTYTEQIAAGEIISEVANEFQRAQCIVFLGFAYHSQNMQILQPDVPLPTAPIYGTAYKMSDSDIDEIGASLSAFSQRT